MVGLRKEAVGVPTRGRQTWKGKGAGGVPAPALSQGGARSCGGQGWPHLSTVSQNSTMTSCCT